MKRLALVTCMALFIVAGCSAAQQPVSPSAKDQIAETTAAWVAAYNSRDPARIASLYHPEAVFWGTTAKTISTNPGAIAGYFKDAPKNPNARVSVGEQHIRVYGGVAINTGSYTFSNVRDGKNGGKCRSFHLRVPAPGRKVDDR